MSQNGTRVYGTCTQPAINVALEAAWRSARATGQPRDVWRVDLPGGGDAWYVTSDGGSPADDNLPAGSVAFKLTTIDQDFVREGEGTTIPWVPRIAK